MTNTIPQLHSLYCQLSGLDLRLGYDRERAWHLFIKAGFNAEDLRCVLIHLKHGIRKGYRHQGSMGFTRLIWGLDLFEEELALARAYARNNQPQTNRQSVIRVFRPQIADATLLRKAYGGQAGPTVNCKPVSHIIPKLIAQLRDAAR